MKDDLISWVVDQLSFLLGFPLADCEEMAKYVLSINDQHKAVEHLSSFLGDSVNALQFIHQFSERRFPKVEVQGSWQSPLKVQEFEETTLQPKQWKNEQNVYKKAQAEDYFVGGYVIVESNRTYNAMLMKNLHRKKAQKKPTTAPPSETDSTSEPKQAAGGSLLSDRLSASSSASSSPKPKPKKQSKKSRAEAAATLAEIEGMVKVGNASPGFGGRLFCECSAAKHGLITNCLTCGKIICRLEGEGPCPQCGTEVHSKEQQLQLVHERKRDRSTNKPVASGTGQRYRHAAGGSMAATAAMPNAADENQFPELDQQALEKAQAQKEKLLDFQRNSAARTRVHDQASDFDYTSDISNQWLSSEERALATKRAQEQRRLDEEQKRRRVISIDLVNKRVVDATPRNVPQPKKEEPAARPPTPPQDPRSSGQFRNPYLNTPAPVFVPVPIKKAEEKSISTLRRKKLANAQEEKAPPAAKQTQKKDLPSRADGKNSRERRAIRRLQHDFADAADFAVSGKGGQFGGSGDYEFDEYGAEGGDGFENEPACG
ncbi:hypothetical protein HK097_003008 [Rhizophlyctis rosea]|uniref:Zinc finger C2HC5-type domain-containing protein n=1 Tax=Rhizophlyctis rosea TaxID=64517 RepID=A0AAD5X6Y7_9FUNG|nr:hypothetical protein HK097_003008 [Rhizophlyctis rosea]